MKQLQNLVINKTKERRLLHKWGCVRPAEIGFQPAHTISRARGQAATRDFESTCHIHGSGAEAQPREVIWILFVGCRDRVRPPGELLPRTDGRPTGMLYSDYLRGFGLPLMTPEGLSILAPRTAAWRRQARRCPPRFSIAFLSRAQQSARSIARLRRPGSL